MFEDKAYNVNCFATKQGAQSFMDRDGENGSTF